MTHPPRFTTVPPKPCDSCPVKTWAVMHDPSSIEGERAVRKHERLRLARMVTAGINHGDLHALRAALQDEQVRRTAGLLVHALTHVLEQLEADDLKETA